MQLAPSVKAYAILPSISLAATGQGTGLQVTPGEAADFDAMVIVNAGAATGTPTTYSAACVVEDCDTVGGTYTTNTTVGTITNTGGAQTVHKAVRINPARPFLRLKATMAFTGGSSPAVPLAATLLVKQSVLSDSNAVAAS